MSIQILPKNDSTYIVQPDPTLSPREASRLRRELQAYGASERNGVLSMDAWLLWNYQSLVHGNSSPPDPVARILHQRKDWLTSSHALEVKKVLTEDQWRWIEYFHLKQEKSGLNTSDPGVGKSLQAIGAILVEDPQSPVLVVTIKGCKYQWVDEFRKLGYGGEIKVLQGREFYMPVRNQVVITNWDNLPPLAAEALDQRPMEDYVRHVPKGFYLIGDEIQKTKSTKAKVTKRWRKLTAEIMKRGGKLIGLTATPLENRPQEFWSVLTGLGLQRQAFGNYDNFAQLFGGQMNRWLKIMEFDESRRDNEEIRHRLSTTMFRIKRNSARERLEREILVDITKNKTLDQLQAETEGLTDQETLQLAMKFENLSKIKTALAKEKQKASVELIESLEDQGPLLVTGCSVDAIQAVGKRKGWAFITGDVSAQQRQQIKNQFNKGELKGLAFTVGAGGVGLNLPVAQNMVVLDLHYNAALVKQALGRNDRHDTEHQVLNYYFVLANHPFDIRLQRIYREKGRLYTDVMDSEELLT